MTLGDRVREARAAKHLTQHQLVSLLPKRHHLSWMSKVETGTMDPTLSDLLGLASALEVSVEWLIEGDSRESLFVSRLRGIEHALDERGRKTILTMAEALSEHEL